MTNLPSDRPSGRDLIDPSPWYSEDTVKYLAGADGRIITGFRFALELVGVPLPEFAKRKIHRRNFSASDVLRHLHADKPNVAIADDQAKFAKPSQGDDFGLTADDVAALRA